MTHNAKPLRMHRLAALSLTFIALPVLGQQAPDVGQLLQEDRPVQSLPKAGPTLQLAPPPSDTTAPGGATVTLQNVHFTGNTVFSSEQLAAVLGDVSDTPYDLAGLQSLAHKVSAHYHAAGYPFARALIPEQNLAAGVLKISVVEGRYGQISVVGQSRFNEAAQDFLAPLEPGSVIEASSLERMTLILSDQPGIKTAPLIRPGQEFGTGDLVVDVAPEPAVKGELGLDNHNNRYTGEYRARVGLQWDSPFMLGDQITVRGNVSNEGQWLGNVGYSLPLGTSGLRGYVGYAHTRYQLTKQFASLDATGAADIASVGLSYPLIRSTRANLALAVTYQYKKLDDRQGAVDISSTKNSHVVPVMVQFDRRDSFWGGGITYGTVGYTQGHLKLDSLFGPIDAASAKTQGSFHKWNLDIARLQATPLSNLTLFGRLSAQWAGKNLDSSEDFGLGGPNGVRAYPMGEGFGDQGGFVQLEARYQIQRFAPYIFYDAGRVTINKNPWMSGNNERKLAGYGLGVRYADQRFSVETSLAWRARGGVPTSDTQDRNPRLWITGAMRF